MTCDKCGLQSEIKEAFVNVGRTLRLKPRHLCPVCQQRRQQAGRRTGLILTAFFGLAGLALVLSGSTTPLGWMMLNYFVFLLMLMVAILPHELGHALAARALGMRVFQVVFGSGRVLYERDWRASSASSEPCLTAAAQQFGHHLPGPRRDRACARDAGDLAGACGVVSGGGRPPPEQPRLRRPARRSPGPGRMAVPGG